MEQTQEQTHVDVQTASEVPAAQEQRARHFGSRDIQFTKYIQAVYALWIFIHQWKKLNREHDGLMNKPIGLVFDRLMKNIVDLGVSWEEVYCLGRFVLDNKFEEYQTCIENNTTRDFVFRFMSIFADRVDIDFVDRSLFYLTICYSWTENVVKAAVLAPPEEDYSEMFSEAIAMKKLRDRS